MIPSIYTLGLFETAIKGLLVLAVTYGIVFICRRKSAATKHCIWTVGLSGTLLLPLFASWFPRIDLEPPIIRQLTQAVSVWITPDSVLATKQSTAVPQFTRRLIDSSVVLGKPSPGWPADQVKAKSLFAPVMLPILWAIVVALLAMKLLYDMLRLRQLASNSMIVSGHDWSNLIESAKRRTGITNTVRVTISDELPVPITWGLFRPVIVLPSTMNECTVDTVLPVLLHELAHVARRDFLWNFLGLVTCACHWFNPLVWIAYRQLVIERERATDNCVLRGGITGTDYADQLLQFARVLASNRVSPGLSSAMADQLGFQARVASILSENTPRGSVSRRTAIAFSVLALLAIAPLACTRVVVKSPDSTDHQSTSQTNDLTIGLPEDAHSDTSVSADTIRALALTGHVIPALMIALEEPDLSTREEKIQTLGSVISHERVRALVATLDAERGSAGSEDGP